MVKTTTSKAKDNLGKRDCLPQVSEFYGAHTASSSGKWTRRTTQAHGVSMSPTTGRYSSHRTGNQVYAAGVPVAHPADYHHPEAAPVLTLGMCMLAKLRKPSWQAHPPLTRMPTSIRGHWQGYKRTGHRT